MHSRVRISAVNKKAYRIFNTDADAECYLFLNITLQAVMLLDGLRIKWDVN